MKNRYACATPYRDQEIEHYSEMDGNKVWGVDKEWPFSTCTYLYRLDFGIISHFHKIKQQVWGYQCKNQYKQNKKS